MWKQWCRQWPVGLISLWRTNVMIRAEPWRSLGTAASSSPSLWVLQAPVPISSWVEVNPPAWGRTLWPWPPSCSPESIGRSACQCRPTAADASKLWRRLNGRTTSKLRFVPNTPKSNRPLKLWHIFFKRSLQICCKPCVFIVNQHIVSHIVRHRF